MKKRKQKKEIKKKIEEIGNVRTSENIRWAKMLKDKNKQQTETKKGRNGEY